MLIGKTFFFKYDDEESENFFQLYNKYFEYITLYYYIYLSSNLTCQLTPIYGLKCFCWITGNHSIILTVIYTTTRIVFMGHLTDEDLVVGFLIKKVGKH